MAESLLHWWLLPGSALLSALFTLGCLSYARRQGLLDYPGARRSHTQVTPRGGGLAIVLTALASLIGLSITGALEPRAALSMAVALASVAGVGFIDDHRPLPALPRLLVHLAAGALLAWPIATALPTPLALLALAAMTLALATLVNFWNFIDGINGLAGVQAAWIAIAIGLLLALTGNAGVALWALALGVAILGFLPFNLPQARIFLGDVGSGFLGLAVGGLLLWAWRDGNLGLPALVILPSAVIIDAGATLLLRMAAGRRWYTAHRSHLYQWLARRGRSHSRIVLMSLIWNLPTTALALGLGPRADLPAFVLAGLVYAIGLAAWLAWRSRLRREAGELA